MYWVIRKGGGRQGEGVFACGGGVCLAKGVSTWPGEVSAWPEGVGPRGGGGVCLVGGVSA